MGRTSLPLMCGPFFGRTSHYRMRSTGGETEMSPRNLQSPAIAPRPSSPCLAGDASPRPAGRPVTRSATRPMRRPCGSRTVSSPRCCTYRIPSAATIAPRGSTGRASSPAWRPAATAISAAGIPSTIRSFTMRSPARCRNSSPARASMPPSPARPSSRSGSASCASRPSRPEVLPRSRSSTAASGRRRSARTPSSLSTRSTIPDRASAIG